MLPGDGQVPSVLGADAASGFDEKILACLPVA
jgi:hypothetical protein